MINLICASIFCCLSLFPISSQKEPVASCTCNCRTCLYVPAGDELFAFPRDRIYHIDMRDGEVVKVPLDEDLKRAVDLLNSFVPLSSEEWPTWTGGDGIWTRVALYDSERVFFFTGSTVTINNTRYTGEEGCLNELVQLFENLPVVEKDSHE